MSSDPVLILKIGGNVLDDGPALQRLLDGFASRKEPKILVHGGGKAASMLAQRLDIPQTLIGGRRVTDPETLKIAVMVYGGLLNRTLVAALQSRGCNALGLAGADLDLIRARKRSAQPVDYGWVGEVERVHTAPLRKLLEEGITPVVAPLSHDGAGNLLNTNADTIAQEIGCALSAESAVRILFCFEKTGVLRNAEDPASLIPEIRAIDFERLLGEGVVSGGMIPKLQNAFRAIDRGVDEVVIGKAENLEDCLAGRSGTRCIRGDSRGT